MLSGLNATSKTQPVCPVERVRSLAAGGVPDPHRLITAAGGDACAVGAKRHADDPAGMPLERVDFVARYRVEHLDQLILAGGGNS